MLKGETALVLEGGGMRGVFTSGFLDALMKHDVHFPYVVGVSAGACNGLSYASWQPGRAHFSNVTLLEDFDYIGINHLIKQGSIFDPDLLYNKLPNDIYPYDYDAYFKNNIIFEQVVTNCRTGRAEYLSEHSGDGDRLLKICHATSSLPFVAKIIEIDGTPYLDGGIVDSIPVKRAFEQGYEKVVVVMTRNRGYRHTSKDHKIPPVIYKEYPRLRVALSRRIKVYNEALDYIEHLEDESKKNGDGKVTVIWPEKPIEVGRMEKNISKLEALYQEGFMLGERYVRSLL